MDDETCKKTGRRFHLTPSLKLELGPSLSRSVIRRHVCFSFVFVANRIYFVTNIIYCIYENIKMRCNSLIKIVTQLAIDFFKVGGSTYNSSIVRFNFKRTSHRRTTDVSPTHRRRIADASPTHRISCEEKYLPTRWPTR